MFLNFNDNTSKEQPQCKTQVLCVIKMWGGGGGGGSLLEAIGFANHE